MTTDLALQALLASVWRRKPKAKVMIHSDQRSQFANREWQLFLGQHNLEASMSRRGNCHDNAVAESFFQLLKRECIRHRTYLTREAARQDVFEYIEMFDNPKRKHTYTGMLSPVDLEIGQQKLKGAGVKETWRTSARPNPAEAWITEDIPHLRIIDDALWQRVKLRQGAIRETMVSSDSENASGLGRRPTYLFSGLLNCGCRGAGYPPARGILHPGANLR